MAPHLCHCEKLSKLLLLQVKLTRAMEIYKKQKKRNKEEVKKSPQQREVVGEMMWGENAI